MSALQASATSPLAGATVGELCSRGVVSCAPESTVADVAATMTSKAFHAAVISAPDSRRALVVTDLDVVRAALAGDLDRPAAEIAREPIATISPSAPLPEAIAEMATRHVAHLLVADPDADAWVGILSSLDVASALAGLDPAVTRAVRPEGSSQVASGSSLAATPVRAVMRRDVVTRPPDTSLGGLAGTMAVLRVHCVAVAGVARSEGVDEHLSWGLLNDMDVVHAAHRDELRAAASEVAVSAPLALSETAGMDRAAELMVAHDSTHIVAVGATGLPSGVVSALDVLRIAAPS